MSETVTLQSIGVVHSSRTDAQDDDWDQVTSSIELDAEFDPAAIAGLDTFSHAEIMFLFHGIREHRVERGARHPRGNSAWPSVGIFAQRGSGRPNRIGATIVKVLKIEGRTLHVAGLDAIDNSPVLDIKPVMKAFLPRDLVHQPAWATELMQCYWDALADEAPLGRRQHLHAVTILVRDYDEAIAYYSDVLGFRLVEDSPRENGKRFVRVAPGGESVPGGCTFLLARAATPEQERHTGNQTGGRVFLFLHTDDFWRDYRVMHAKGVAFLEEPRHEQYGTVVVFTDLYGNKWDFIGPKAVERPGHGR